MNWKEKTVAKSKNGKIIMMQNVSAIYNDVSHYVLLDSKGMFVAKSIDFNQLNKMLYK